MDDDDEEDDEDVEMEDEDEDSDGGGDWWGSVLSRTCSHFYLSRIYRALMLEYVSTSALTTPRIRAFPSPRADRPAGAGSSSTPSPPNRKKPVSDSNEAAPSAPSPGNTTIRSGKDGTFRQTTRPTTSAGASSTFVSRGGTSWER